MRARVIGLGQSAAGDDGVGVAVVHALRERGLPIEIEVHQLAEPSALIALLDSAAPVILVDAVLGERAGEVVELSAEELASRAPLRLSSHGLGVSEAIGLARILNDGGDLPAIRIVAVTITRPDRYQHGLSPEVAAAVPRAAERVLSILEVDRA